MPELAQALSLTALVAATLQYAIVVRRRAEARDAIQWQTDVRESLVSVGSPAAMPARHWTRDGRFRLDR